MSGEGRERCAAAVWKRDTYRYSGGKQRFKMNYKRCRCTRPATENGRCWQHQNMGSADFERPLTNRPQTEEPTP